MLAERDCGDGMLSAYSNLLKRILSFDDEMSQAGKRW